MEVERVESEGTEEEGVVHEGGANEEADEEGAAALGEDTEEASSPLSASSVTTLQEGRESQGRAQGQRR